MGACPRKLTASPVPFIVTPDQELTKRLCCIRPLLLQLRMPRRSPTRLSSSVILAGTIDRDKYKVPLNEREALLLHQTWKYIHKNIFAAGADMFTMLFTQKPEVKELYQKFRTMDTVGNLNDSVVLQNHGLIVMNAIDEVISGIDESDYVIALLLEHGRSHGRFRGLTEDALWSIEEPFLTVAKRLIGSHYTPNVDKLYSKVIQYILTVLCLGFNQALDEQAEDDYQKAVHRNDKQRDSTSNTLGVPSVSNIVSVRSASA